MGVKFGNLWGEKPQNRPLSKLNTGRFALRAMLPVKKKKIKITSAKYITACSHAGHNKYKNSSADEIANVNFYAVRPEGTQIR